MIGEDIKLSVHRMHKLNGSTSALKAFCDIAINDSFIVKGLRVIEGKNGLFVGMPQEAGKDGKWYSTFLPIRKEAQDGIEKMILEAYAE